MAFSARKANKQYVRERSNIIVSLFAKGMDLWRHWTLDGLTEIRIWNKKARHIREEKCIISNENDEVRKQLLWNDKVCSNVCGAILKSSTKTNKIVDDMTGRNDDENTPRKRRKPQRKAGVFNAKNVDINEAIHNEL